VEYLDFISGCLRNLLLYGYIENACKPARPNKCVPGVRVFGGVGGGVKGGCMKVKFQMLQSREATCAPFSFYVTWHTCVCA
jgi:hypothetical protein